MIHLGCKLSFGPEYSLKMCALSAYLYSRWILEEPNEQAESLCSQSQFIFSSKLLPFEETVSAKHFLEYAIVGIEETFDHQRLETDPVAFVFGEHKEFE